MNILSVMNNAVDWLSVKLTGVCIPFLFIGNTVTYFLGIVVMSSTLVYNVIRIYKECKTPK